MVAQHSQVRDRLAAVGELYRHIDRDPARVARAPPLPQTRQSITERGVQPGHLRDVSEQPGAGMTDNTTPVSTHDDLRACSGNLHSAGALRLDG
jgi:hypothetical protein